MKNITGSFNITLPFPTVEESGIDHETNVASMAVSLMPVTVEGAGKSGPPDETGSCSITLQSIAASFGGVVGGGGSYAVQLPPVGVSFSGSVVSGVSVLAVRLPFPKVVFLGRVTSVNVPGKIYCLNSTVRSNSSALLMFKGPANKVLTWEIQSGGGVIEVISSYTDQYGIAYARYRANGYQGQVKIGARYGS